VLLRNRIDVLLVQRSSEDQCIHMVFAESDIWLQHTFSGHTSCQGGVVYKTATHHGAIVVPNLRIAVGNRPDAFSLQKAWDDYRVGCVRTFLREISHKHTLELCQHTLSTMATQWMTHNTSCLP